MLKISLSRFDSYIFSVHNNIQNKLAAPSHIIFSTLVALSKKAICLSITFQIIFCSSYRPNSFTHDLPNYILQFRSTDTAAIQRSNYVVFTVRRSRLAYDVLATPQGNDQGATSTDGTAVQNQSQLLNIAEIYMLLWLLNLSSINVAT